MGCVVSKDLDCNLTLVNQNLFLNNNSTNFGASIAYYLMPHQDPENNTIFIDNIS